MIRRIRIRVSVCALTFLIGVLVSPTRFYLESSAAGKVFDGGGRYVVRTYRSSYFVGVTVSTEEYSSQEKANEVFESRVLEATRLIERNQKLNRNGKMIGERAVAIFVNAQNNNQSASVFWVAEHKIISDDSTSLVHVLEFEKRQAF